MGGTLYVGNRNYSSWSIRGSLLLRQSGADCAEVVIPLDTDEGRAKIAQVSPSRRVPVLHYDALVIWDSLAIAEYLAERHPHMWPKDPNARAFARRPRTRLASPWRRRPWELRSRASPSSRAASR